MSWIPTVVYWIGIITPVVWLWTGETREVESNQALLVVIVMFVTGALATVLLAMSVGTAGLAQLGVGFLSLVMFLVMLGFFGMQVGIANVVDAIIPF